MSELELPLSRTVHLTSTHPFGNRADAAATEPIDRRSAGTSERESLVIQSARSSSPEDPNVTIAIDPVRNLLRTPIYSLVSFVNYLPTLPLVFRRVGIIPGIVLILLVGGLSSSSLALRTIDPPSHSTRRTYHRNRLEDIIVTFETVKRASELLFLVGSLVAQQVLLRDTAASTIDLLHARNPLLTVIILVSAPFWLRDERRPIPEPAQAFVPWLTTSIGVLSTLFLCSILLLRAYQRSQIPHAHQPVEWVSAEFDLLSALPIIVVCFIEARLSRPQRRQHARKRDSFMIQLQIFLFIFVGTCGYAFAGKETTGNVWLCLSSDDVLARIGKNVYCGFLWLSIPTTIRKLATLWSDAAPHAEFDSSDATTRASICANRINGEHEPQYLDSGSQTGATTINGNIDEASSTDEGEHVLQLHRMPCTTNERPLPGKSSIPLLIITFITSTFVQRLENVWDFLGSTVGLWLCFTYPLVGQFLTSRSQEPPHYSMLTKGSHLICLALLSLVLSILCTAHAIQML